MKPVNALTDVDLLALWEHGERRHPLDRALLLAAWARTDLAPSELADLPVGVVNETLIRLRAANFGQHIEAWIDCAHCNERLALELDTDVLLAAATDAEVRADMEVAGLRFRSATLRDLAAVADQCDPDAAALRLLQRCCLSDGADTSIDLAGRLAEVEEQLEAVDPLAVISLALTCTGCKRNWMAPVDIASLLWDELAARARRLLAEVDALASAYGWSEAQIVSLSAPRRAAYLGMVAS